MTALKYHKLFIHDHINSRELSEVYFSEHSNQGQMFILMELPKQKIDQQPIIDRIIREVAGQFSLERQSEPEIALEKILQKLNQLLPDLIPPKLNNWLNTLDFVVAIIHQDSVYLASLGSMNGLLIHNNQTTPILEKTKNVNVVKVFSDIVSGDLEDDDVLVISTDSLFDYISQEKIKQLVKKFPPDIAVREIKILLQSVPNFVNFNSVIIKKPGRFEDSSAAIESSEPDSDDASDNSNWMTESEFRSSAAPSKARPKEYAAMPKPKTKLVVDYENLKKDKSR